MSADKTAKIWDITEDGNGKVIKTLTPPGIGGIDDMLIACFWQKDKLLTVSLGGLFNLYSALDLDQDPLTFSGHMKNVNSLSCVVQDGQKRILSTSYDGVIVKWIPGFGFGGRILRKENTQIKCFLVTEGEILTSGFDNKVMSCYLCVLLLLFWELGTVYGLVSFLNLYTYFGSNVPLYIF